MTKQQLQLAALQAAPAYDGPAGEFALPEGFATAVFARLPDRQAPRLSRWAACLALALTLACAALLTLSPQIRAAVQGWLTREVPGGAGYQFQGTGDYGRIPDYRLGYVPAGFTPANPIRDGGSVNQSFFGLGGRGRFLAIKCNETYPYALYLDTENAEPTVASVRLGKGTAEYYTIEDGRSAALVWRSQDESTLFCITGPFTQKTMVTMAESLYIAQKEVPQS